MQAVHKGLANRQLYVTDNESGRGWRVLAIRHIVIRYLSIICDR